MNKLLLLLLIISLENTAWSQMSQQQKTDSVCALVKKYFNEKNAAKIYDLTGKAFQKEISLGNFIKIGNNNLFPLAPLKETVFQKNTDGVSKYKAVFTATNLALYLSLDKENKIETFLFQPYIDDRKKNYPVPSTNKLATALDKKTDSAAQAYITLLPTTGLSIGILKEGKLYFYGYGETAKGNHQIPDEHTLFEIGSITKTFTATLLALAVGEGKVKLDDPVNKYLPDSAAALQYEGTPVTLKTLSNHSSGIPGLPFNFAFYITDANNPYKNYDKKQLFAFYKYFKPVRKPGLSYEYSNLAAGTLGAILEGIYKKNYEALVTEKICMPLRMNETKQLLTKNDSAHFAKGYNEQGIYNEPWDFEALAGAGSIRSTAADLLRYAQANMGDAPAALNKAFQLTHIITFTDGQNKVGLGWHYIKPGKDSVLFHNGGTGGYRSYLAINTGKKFAVVVLSNTAIGTENVGNDIMQWLEKN